MSDRNCGSCRHFGLQGGRSGRCKLADLLASIAEMAASKRLYEETGLQGASYYPAAYRQAGAAVIAPQHGELCPMWEDRNE